MNKGAIRLYKKIKSKDYNPENICEVGVYLPQESNLLNFINEDIKTTLVEANPEYVKNIRSFFSEKKNVKIIEAAVFDFNGKIELCKKGASSFISELKSSPAIINDHYKKDGEKFIANSIVFSEIDHGDFDLVSVDIEGAEWYVIKHMISRPKVISIETHGKYYTNPNILDIEKWMKSNDYMIWYKDESDSIYVKNGIFEISFLEKIQLVLRNLKINIHKQEKILKKQ